MTVMEIPKTETAGVENTAIEPLPELETVPDAGDAAFAGALADSEIDDSCRVELEFLTALVWAPPEITRQVVAALVGDARSVSTADTIPRTADLLWQPAHEEMWRVIVELVDEGAPATPVLVQTRIAEAGKINRLRRVVLDLASPSGRGPLPGGGDVPYLAAAIADAWYRRGFRSLRKRMEQAEEERPTAELAGWWTALTAHQQTAERRWLAVRDTLAKI